MTSPAECGSGAVYTADDDQLIDIHDQPNEALNRDNYEDPAAGVVPAEYLTLPGEAGYFDRPDSGWFSMTEEDLNALYGTVMTGVDTSPPNDDHYSNEIYMEPYNYDFAVAEPLADMTLFKPKIKNMRQDLDLNLFLQGSPAMSDESWGKWQQDNFETDSEDEDWNGKYRPKNYVKRRDTKVAKEVFEQISREFPMFYPPVNASTTTQLPQRLEVSEPGGPMSTDGGLGKKLTGQDTPNNQLSGPKKAVGDKETGANSVLEPEEKVHKPQEKLPVRRSPRKHRSNKPYNR